MPTRNPNVDWNVEFPGSNLVEQKTHSNAVGGVLTFSAPIQTIEIFNTDATNTGIFTVNGIQITVPPNTPFKSSVAGTPSANVTVTGTTTYIVSRYV
jgi:hypothetical protein